MLIQLEKAKAELHDLQVKQDVVHELVRENIAKVKKTKRKLKKALALENMAESASAEASATIEFQQRRCEMRRDSVRQWWLAKVRKQACTDADADAEITQS